MALKQYLENHIRQHGPMDVGQFMNIALGHPQHGYYVKKDPFGAAGDFTTAPEISQMFGEVIGAWVADVWMQMGKPDFTLLECGPGRGTLMADMLRATANVDSFAAACAVHLLEMSPVLREIQKEILTQCGAPPHPTAASFADAQQASVSLPPMGGGQGGGVVWHETLDTIPMDKPIIVIANEFLDALPVRQLQKTDKGWRERVVHCVDGFAFGLRDAASDIAGMVPRQAQNAALESVCEVSPARTVFVQNLCSILQRAGGAALFLDYGHDRPGTGDTLQALRKHKYVPVFDHIGDADLTAHVDFAALKDAATAMGAAVSGPVEQGAFLKSLGIEQRAAALGRGATHKQKQDIQSALHRLADSGEMGSLFKVMGLHYGPGIRLAGF